VHQLDLHSTATTNKKRWQRGGPAMVAWVLQVLGRDPCAYCGAPSRTVDHIVPMVAGGTANPDNLTAACQACNGAKADSSLLEFLLSRLA